MFTIIRNGEVYNPDHMGTQDILVAFDRILEINPHIHFSYTGQVHEIDASGKIVTPGFIDQHVHITGGGGEGGPVTRTPEIILSDLIRGGVTTVIGLLGADGITRSVPELLAKARALDYEGISTYIYSGSYQIPTTTATGSIISDLILIDKVIGIGEIAISDHRSANPTPEMLIRIASEGRIGGMLGGKAGIIHVHLGEGKQGMRILFDILDHTDLPITQFVPTHVNRLERIFKEAVHFSQMGGVIDLTAGINRENASPTALEVKQALKLALDEELDFSRITVSSDGNGSLPKFDSAGSLEAIEIGSVAELWKDIRRAVTEDIIPLETALSLITRNVAHVLKLLPAKGILAAGSDADILLLNKEDYKIDTVMAKGKLMAAGGKIVHRGFFEK